MTIDFDKLLAEMDTPSERKAGLFDDDLRAIADTVTSDDIATSTRAVKAVYDQDRASGQYVLENDEKLIAIMNAGKKIENDLSLDMAKDALGDLLIANEDVAKKFADLDPHLDSLAVIYGDITHRIDLDKFTANHAYRSFVVYSNIKAVYRRTYDDYRVAKTVMLLALFIAAEQA